MPTINLSWNPANDANTSGQIAKAIAKVNGTTPNIITDFSPTNTMAKSVNNAVYNASNTNIVYRFTVETICFNGGPTLNTNGVQEQMMFTCVPESTITKLSSRDEIQVSILKGQYLSVDGVSHPDGTSSIEGVEYTLYNSTNTAPIASQGPFLVNVTTGVGANESFRFTFTNLTASTNYTIRYVLTSTINGLEVRSDQLLYMGTFCTTLKATTNVQSCYLFENNTGADITDQYIDCVGRTQTATIGNGGNLCARSVGIQGLTQNGLCPF